MCKLKKNKMSTWTLDEFKNFFECHNRSTDTKAVVRKTQISVVSTEPIRKNDPCRVFVNNTLVYENRFHASECDRVADMFMQCIVNASQDF